MCLKFLNLGFSGGSDGKESAHDEGDLGLNPRLGSSLREGRGSGLENSMDRGAWQATAHGATKSLSDMTECLSL